jgi:hypothetical protein
VTTVRLFRILAWLLLAALVFVTLAPIGLRPETPLPTQLERAVALALIGFVCVLAYPRHTVLVVVLLVGFTAFLEAAQLFDPGRHGRLIDFLAKFAGVVCGATPAWLLAKWRFRHVH